jgi:hypothetical protein
MVSSRASFSLSVVAFWIVVAVCVAASPASASLGGNFASVQDDQLKLQASLQTTSKDSYSVHEIRVPNGMVVREFIAPRGNVFGIAWQGPGRPNLRQLLGTYFDSFAKQAEMQKTGRVGRGPLVIREPGLVVEMAGHGRSFFGRAYDPRIVPAGVSAGEVK